MKKTIIVLTFLAVSYTGYTQETGNANARIIKGKEVYIYSQPVKKYDVVFTYSTAAAFANPTFKIDVIVETVMINCERKTEKKKIDYDGIIYDGGESYSLIKFKE